MNPKPFSSLNHFTVPVGMSCSSAAYVSADAEDAREQRRRALARFARRRGLAEHLATVATRAHGRDPSLWAAQTRSGLETAGLAARSNLRTQHAITQSGRW